MTSRVLRQRGDGDCGVAALAAYSGTAYEDAYLAVATVDKTWRKRRGLHNHEVLRAARHLGLKLTPTKRYDLDDDEGVLRVRFDGEDGGGHFVAVRRGLIIDPADGTVRPWSDYLAVQRARPCTLLRGHED